MKKLNMKGIVAGGVALLVVAGGVIWGVNQTNAVGDVQDAIVLQEGVADAKEAVELNSEAIASVDQVLPVLPVTSNPSIDSMPWAYLGENQAGVQIYLQSGPGASCGEFSGVRVIETEESVTIAVLSNQLESVEGISGCNAAGVSEIGTVALKEPLGDRKLFHATVHSAFGLSPWTPETLKLLLPVA